MGYVTEFIKQISKRSQVVAHQLIWNMQTNMYMDEDQQHKDREYHHRKQKKKKKIRSFSLINLIVSTFSDSLFSCFVRSFGVAESKYHIIIFGCSKTLLRA